MFSVFAGAKSADWTDGFFGCSFLNVLLVYCYGLYPDDDRKLWSMTFPEPRRMWAAFSDHWLTGKAKRDILWYRMGIAFSCLISGWILWLMVDITNYLMGFINQQTSLGGGSILYGCIWKWWICNHTISNMGSYMVEPYRGFTYEYRGTPFIRRLLVYKPILWTYQTYPLVN